MYFFNLKQIFNFSFSEFQLVPFQASHMEYSIYITISTILFFYYFLKSKNNFIKIILFLLSIISIILLFLLEGRTGQLSFIITFLLLAIIYSKKNIHLIISFSSIIIILSSAYLLSTNFNSRINKGLNDLIEVTNSNYNTSLGVRLSSYKIIPEIIQSTNLLFGVGIGDSRDITTQINKKIYNDSFDGQKGLLHQSFLTIFHSVGLMGITLFIFSLYKLYTLKINDNEINFVKYVFVVSLIVDLMTNEFFRQREILLLFALFSSIIVISSVKKIES
jgi:O-antigen ligase